MSTPILNWDALKQHIRDGATPTYLFFWRGTKPRNGQVTKTCFSQWYREAFETEAVVDASARPFQWKGLNLLGFALHAVRRHLRR